MLIIIMIRREMYIYSFIINFCKQLLKYDNFATT